MTAEEVGDPGKDNVYGAGRLNVLAAVELALQGFAAQDVTIELTPLGTPIVIPPGGGSFQFTITIANNEASEVTFLAWTDALLPDLSTYGPILNRTITLSPSGSLTRTLTQNVPAGAPAGNYNYNAYVGFFPDNIWNKDSFSFSKSGSDSESGSENWATTGWDEPSASLPAGVPTEFSLTGVYPNPFNPTTTFTFALPEAARVNLTVYDVSGRQVATLVNGWRDAGIHEVTFDASNLTSGVYLYRLSAADFSAVGKMVLMK